MVSWEEADGHAAGLVRMKILSSRGGPSDPFPRRALGKRSLGGPSDPDAGPYVYFPRVWETQELRAATRAFLESLPAQGDFYQYERLARELVEVLPTP